MLDPYKTLGVSESASQEEIKKAFKRLARQHHPDRNPNDKDAEVKFKQINEAFSLIGSDEKRKKYKQEQQAQEYFRQASAGGSRAQYGGFNFGTDDIDPELLRSIFEEMGGIHGFGARSAQEGSPFGQKKQAKHQWQHYTYSGQRGEDVEYQMEIGFWDAIMGGQRIISLPEGRQMEVKIPVGIQSGKKLRFKGQGTPGRGGGNAGDLFVELKVAEDSQVKREGQNLVVKQLVPIDTAILGGQILINLPTGRFSLKIPPLTDHGKKLRLKGKGVAGEGDLIVEVNLILPQNGQDRLSELMRQFKQGSPKAADSGFAA